MNDITEVDRLNAEIADLKRTIEWYQGRTGIMMGVAAGAALAAVPASELEMWRVRYLCTAILNNCVVEETKRDARMLYDAIESKSAAPAPVSGMPDLAGLIKDMRPPSTMIRCSDSYIEGFAKARAMAADLAASTSPAPAQPAPSPKEIVDRLLAGTASAKCPLCGISHPHNHSPLEIIIFRNGYKSGVRNASPWYDNQSDAQDGEAHATKFGGSVRPDANQHHEHRSGQPDANCADAGSDCRSAGVSRGGAIPEDRNTGDNAGRLAVGGAAPAQQQEPSAK